MGRLSNRLKRLNLGARADKGRLPGHQTGQGGTLDVFTRDLHPRRVDQPAAGSQICDGLTVYHDARAGLFSWQQTVRKAVKLTVYQFEGSYLSLAIGMSEKKIDDMHRAGFLEIKKGIQCTRPIAAFLRLNLQIEGEPRQMHQTLIVDRGDRKTVFDLDGLPGESGHVENAWLDLIFPDPRMVEITLSSLAVGSAPAETKVA